jgi:D-3-phosphoglycerate dehydrogenase
MIRILNTSFNFAPQAKPILESLGAVEYRSPTHAELVKLVPNYDVLFVGLGLRIDRAVLDAGKRVRFIVTGTTGLDHIDTAYAKERGIEVLSLRGENEFLDTITGTAELAWGLVIALLRQFPNAFDDVKQGRWRRNAYPGHNLYGQTLGVVGLGRLGKMTARFGRAFGMQTIYTDPAVPAGTFPEYENVSFDELLRKSDVISIHVHLSKETEHMFDEQAFAKMKEGAILVNTSRGKIVDEAACLAALESGRLGGYGADVLADELSFKEGTKIPKRHPLVSYAASHGNAIILPHIGGNTIESRQATDVFMSKKLATAL